MTRERDELKAELSEIEDRAATAELAVEKLSAKGEEFQVPRGAKARLLYDMPQDTNNAITLYKAPKEYIAAERDRPSERFHASL